MSFYGDPYGFGGGYGPPSYYPAYPAQYYSSGNTVYHHRRKPPKEKDNAQVWCDICDVGCIGQQSYIEHCGGRKHQLLERKKTQQLSSASPQEGQRHIETDQPATTTTTTTTPGTSTVRFNPYESSPQGTKGSQGKFYCELCKIYSNDHSTFQLHLAGKKHKINVQRQQSAASDPHGPNMNPISSMSMIHPPRYHISSSPRSHFTPTLTNTPTNVEDDLLLNSKLESLTPSTSDTLSLRHLVETVTAKLDEFSENNISSQQSQSTPAIVETKLVGPYAWGTLLKVNLIADIAVITKEHPTFGTLRFMQQALSIAVPEAHMEIGKDTMDMHIRMPQGAGVHLLFTWVGSWESGEREEQYMYPKPQDYAVSPSPSPPSSPLSQDSPFPPLTYTNHPTSEPSKTPAGGPWIVKPWTTTHTPWIPSNSQSSQPPPTATTTTTTTTSTSTRSPSPGASMKNEDGSPPSTHAPQGPIHTSIAPSTTTPSSASSLSPQTPSASTPEPFQVKDQDPEPPPLPQTLPPQSTPSPTPTTTDLQDINMLASQRALLMIRQAMWFSHNSLSPNVRQCIKIMKDLRHRHTAFAAVNNWALEVMVVNALRTLPLSASISQSLRAIFAFVASGTLLPGVDLLDPCVQYGSVLQDLTQEERLAITKAAQKILNDIAFGRWEVIVG